MYIVVYLFLAKPVMVTNNLVWLVLLSILLLHQVLTSHNDTILLATEGFLFMIIAYTILFVEIH